MHCLCIAYALPVHCLCIACALPVHLEVPYVARPIRRFLPWNAWVLVVWNPVLPSWWFPKASMIQIDHYFLGWNQQPATMVSIIPLEDLSKWKGLAPSWGPQHHHVWTFIVYLINGGHASSIIPMPEDNTNIHIYIIIYILLYIYIQCGLPILCLGYLGITRQHVCSFLVPALSIHDRRRKAFEVGPSTGPGGPPLHALGHRNGCIPSGNLT